MKTFRWCLLVLVALCSWSCKQSTAEFTPYIQVSYFYLNPVFEGEKIVSAADTLSVRFMDGAYVIDSINRDDKVVFQVHYGSYANELVAARIVFDTTQLNMYPKLSQELQSVLLPSSDVRNIQLYINPGCNGLSFPVIYQPMQSGTFQFGLICESDSKLSPCSMQYKQPVR